MSDTGNAGLGAAQIDEFIDRGYVGLQIAFSDELARKGREEIWLAMGLSPDDPVAWTRPVVRSGLHDATTIRRSSQHATSSRGLRCARRYGAPVAACGPGDVSYPAFRRRTIQAMPDGTSTSASACKQ